jgi:branched-chain amino acid transport system substrate-binding protein
MLLPGVKLSMSPTDLRSMKQIWLQRFDGERWRLFGDVVDVTK